MFLFFRMPCVIIKQPIEMSANNNVHITANGIEWIRQLLSYIAILFSSEVAVVVFIVSSSYLNTNFWKEP